MPQIDCSELLVATPDLFEEHSNISVHFYASLVVICCTLLDKEFSLHYLFLFFVTSLFDQYCLPHLFGMSRCPLCILFLWIFVSVLYNVFYIRFTWQRTADSNEWKVKSLPLRSSFDLSYVNVLSKRDTAAVLNTVQIKWRRS